MIFEEDLSGVRDQNNFIAFPVDSAFYKSTMKALAWQDCFNNNTGHRMVPGVIVESLFRRAPVADPDSLIIHGIMTKCLDVDGYLVGALDLLVTEGLLEKEDEDGNTEGREFESQDELQAAADKLVLDLQASPELQVDIGSFEWLEGFSNRPQDADVEWFNALTLKDLTSITKDLTVYIDLSLIVGPRSTEDARIDGAGTFRSIVGGPQGGQLGQAIKTYYYAGQTAQQIPIHFILRRIASFSVDTQWPAVYFQHFPQMMDYAFDLTARAAWKTATRLQWVSLIDKKLPAAIQNHLPVHKLIFEDYIESGSGGQLVREVHQVDPRVDLGQP